MGKILAIDPGKFNSTVCILTKTDLFFINLLMAFWRFR
jgi:hypothetical protein